MNPAVDTFIEKAQRWPKELKVLREIVLETGLVEELKWKQPCYTYKGVNVLMIAEFKDNCVISFLKGTLLFDSEKLLIKPGENSQSVRFMRFTSVDEILRVKSHITAYIFEAIELEKAGLKVDTSQNKILVFPDELLNKFKENPDFEKAFLALTTGRQRAYNMHFTETKVSKTRELRIDKFQARILAGKGMNDCICGLSKRMPTCDGSHKILNVPLSEIPI